MSELKPCPRCGAEAHVATEDGEPTMFLCEDCGSWLDVSEFETTENAFKWWNDRPFIDALTARIAELEADNKKAFDLVRKLRMYCIWANWDNPDTEDEFNEFDVEVCKWLSEFTER